jgi:hypothetical protein
MTLERYVASNVNVKDTDGNRAECTIDKLLAENSSGKPSSHTTCGLCTSSLSHSTSQRSQSRTTFKSHSVDSAFRDP